MDKDAANEGVISPAAARVALRVMRTEGELMIAHSVCRDLELHMVGEEKILAMQRNTLAALADNRQYLMAAPIIRNLQIHMFWTATSFGRNSNYECHS